MAIFGKNDKLLEWRLSLTLIIASIAGGVGIYEYPKIKNDTKSLEKLNSLSNERDNTKADWDKAIKKAEATYHEAVEETGKARSEHAAKERLYYFAVKRLAKTKADLDYAKTDVANFIPKYQEAVEKVTAGEKNWEETIRHREEIKREREKEKALYVAEALQKLALLQRRFENAPLKDKENLRIELSEQGAVITAIRAKPIEDPVAEAEKNLAKTRMENKETIKQMDKLIAVKDAISDVLDARQAEYDNANSEKEGAKNKLNGANVQEKKAKENLDKIRKEAEEIVGEVTSRYRSALDLPDQSPAPRGR